MRRKASGQSSSAHDDIAGHLNPLLRDCDVRQTRIKHWVIALMVVMIPVSLWIGASAHTAQQQRLDNQRSSIHQVTATTTAAAEAAPVGSTELGSTVVASSTSVDSRWTYQGVEHTGLVSFDTGSPVGTTTPIWVDNNGDRTVRPLTSADVTTAYIFDTIGSWVLVATVLLGFYHLMRLRYDGMRYAEWDREIADLLGRH